jgi:hypothetical protein
VIDAHKGSPGKCNSRVLPITPFSYPFNRVYNSNTNDAVIARITLTRFYLKKNNKRRKSFTNMST